MKIKPILLFFLVILLILFGWSTYYLSQELRETQATLKRKEAVLKNYNDIQNRVVELDFRKRQGWQDYKKVVSSQNGKERIEFRKDSDSSYSILAFDTATNQEITEDYVRDYYNAVTRLGLDLDSHDVIFSRDSKYVYVIYRDFIGGLDVIFSARYARSGINSGLSPGLEDIEILAQLDGSTYVGISPIAFYPETQTLVASIGGGDACVSGGIITVWKNGSKVRDIQEYAAGCAEGPRFLGLIQDKLFFAESKPIEGNEPFSYITKVFSIDPITFEKRSFPYDLSSLNLDTSYSDNTSVLSASEVFVSPFSLDSDNKVMILDVLTGEVREEN